MSIEKRWIDVQEYGRPSVGDTWITNIQHFLDENGAFPEDLPGPARNLAKHLGLIITVATSPSDSSTPEMSVRCRRRPKRKPCPGMIDNMIEPGGEERIFWRCPVCGDNGVISKWKGSIWDCRDMGSMN